MHRHIKHDSNSLSQMLCIAVLAACTLSSPVQSFAATTLTQTVRRATPTSYSQLVQGPGEPYIVRSIFPYLSVPMARQPLVAFAHLSDIHIIDDQSPLRVPFMDRYETFFGTGSAYRAHEMLTTQVADSMVRSIRNVGTAPATGLPLRFTIVTGDATDNMQYNETRWFMNLLDGAPIWPKSSGSLEESVGAPWNWQSYYWHPETDTSPIDDYKHAHFPNRVADLFWYARQPFQATGLGMPWYSVMGNHDATVQGNLPMGELDDIPGIPTLTEMATGSDRVVDVYGLPAFPSNYTIWDGIWDAVEGKLSLGHVAATPNSDRRLLSKGNFIAEHFNTNGWPAGHGFTGTDKAYYTIPSPPDDPFFFIALDSTNTNEFGPDGWIPNDQFDWLQQQLVAHSSKYRTDLSSGTFVYQPGVEDKLIVLFSHHTLGSMGKVSTSAFGSAEGKSGAELTNLLLRFPNVVLYVDGHTHSNNIWPHSIQFSDTNKNAFWEVNSASLIDWPIQSRLIEVAQDNNMLSVFTTMLDADAPLSYGGDLTSPRQLASLGRELAANDPQELGAGIDRRRGVDPSVRNTQSLLPMPFHLDVDERNFDAWATDPNVIEVKGDFDHDGCADIALIGGYPWHTIPVAFSTGEGNFRITNADVGWDFTAWARTPGVQVFSGDFNGDGRTDIALLGGDPSWWHTIPIAFSNGDGTFRITNFDVGAFNSWFAAAAQKPLLGDFNGDGRTDIALAGGAGWTTMPVAFSRGDGSFNVTNAGSGDFARWSATANVKAVSGDFDGDGRTDIALYGGAGWTSMPVAYSRANGTFVIANFSSSDVGRWGSTANVKAITGDFDHDGKTDIAFSGGSGWGSIPVAFSRGVGSFAVTNVSVPDFGRWGSTANVKAVAGDFNGDGRTDIALVGGIGWGSIPVAYSLGAGSFSITNQSQIPFGALAAMPNMKAIGADFTGDGHTDILLIGAGQGLPIAKGGVAGSFTVVNMP